MEPIMETLRKILIKFVGDNFRCMDLENIHRKGRRGKNQQNV